MAIGVSNKGVEYFLGLMFTGGFYVALLTGQPNVGMTGTNLADVEVARLSDGDATGYTRVLCAAWTISAGGFVLNTAELDYGTPLFDWGQVSGWALCSAAVDGDLYAFGEFANPRLVGAGNDFIVDPGALIITLSSPRNSIVA
jgi:hypothetical protein